MPIGIITDVTATLAGSIIGCVVGSKLSDKWKDTLNNTMGIIALVMGITLIMKFKNLSAAVLAFILGSILGEMLDLDTHVNSLVKNVTGKVFGGNLSPEQMAIVSTGIVLFCFGGTGWYGSINEGITGDGSIMMIKAILDGITALIFASIAGKIVCCIPVPQAVFFLLLFSLAGFIGPYITPSMVADFSSVGGMVTLCSGLKLTKMKTDIKTLNLLPGILLAFFTSAAWTALIG